MKIAEIFYSIQGEGILTGVPSVFVRTSGCNLRCTWCDTPYTSWRPEGEALTLEQIVSAVAEHGCKHVVVTGGEPMVAAGIVELTHQMGARDWHITVETAGTVFQPVACDLMSISPKLSNSTPHSDEVWADRHEARRFQPEVLHELISRYEYQLKFVIVSPADLEEANVMVEQIGAQRDRVLLMPEANEPATLAQRSQWLVEICKRTGYRFCPRLHVEIWGARRGV